MLAYTRSESVLWVPSFVAAPVDDAYHPSRGDDEPVAGELTSKDIAAEIDTDPRTLRRFLRDDNTYRNAGSGGRYVFTQKDIPTLKKRFDKWAAGVATRRAKRDTSGLIKKTKPVEIEPEVIPIPKCTPYLRRLEQEQIARLDDRLRECGLHVSQLRERAGWVEVETAVAS